MNDRVKTLLFVGTAVVLFGLALFYSPSVSPPAYFDDEGTLFFPEFENPSAVKAFEVVQYDSGEDRARKFRVEFQGSGWVIPSHQNYPADATVVDPLDQREIDRVARAAGLLIGLEKQSIRSDDTSDLAKFGVVDPEEPGGARDGFGTKVTFRDQNSQVLASLIIGNPVDGDAEKTEGDDDGPEALGVRYVRQPGTNRIYTADLPGALSARFRDWVETDLLKIGDAPTTPGGLPEAEVQKLVFDNYSVDETTGVIDKGEVLTANKVNHSWKLQGLDEATETLKTTPLSNAARELDQLTIVGVRAKPPEIQLQDRQTGKITSIPQDFSARGYFLGEDGSIRSNEGDLIALTNQGVRYTLRFGELVFGSPDEVSMESTDGGATPAEDSDQKNRYLLVDVSFDESVFASEKPSLPRLDEEELGRRSTAKTRIEQYVEKINDYKKANDSVPATLEALTEGEDPLLEAIDLDPWGNEFVYTVEPEGDFTLVSYGADGEPEGDGAATDLSSRQIWAEMRFLQAAQDWKAYDAKIAQAKKVVEDLKARFGPWYYVIDAKSFDKLKLERSDLVEPKEPEESGPAPLGPVPGGG